MRPCASKRVSIGCFRHTQNDMSVNKILIPRIQIIYSMKLVSTVLHTIYLVVIRFIADGSQ
jgi:hypothetical protein